METKDNNLLDDVEFRFEFTQCHVKASLSVKIDQQALIFGCPAAQGSSEWMSEVCIAVAQKVMPQIAREVQQQHFEVLSVLGACELSNLKTFNENPNV